LFVGRDGVEIEIEIKSLNRGFKWEKGNGLSFPYSATTFKDLVTDRSTNKNYFLDVTLMIYELFEDQAFRIYLYGPRRFGKTINLDMIALFLNGCFRKNEQHFKEVNSLLFKDKKIQHEKYAVFREKQFQKYIVIRLDFQELKSIRNFEDFLLGIAKIMIEIYEYYNEFCKENRNFNSTLEMLYESEKKRKYIEVQTTYT